MLIVEGVFEHHVYHEDIMQIRVVDIVRPDAVEGPGRSIVNRGMGKMAGRRAGNGDSLDLVVENVVGKVPKKVASPTLSWLAWLSRPKLS